MFRNYPPRNDEWAWAIAIIVILCLAIALLGGCQANPIKPAPLKSQMALETRELIQSTGWIPAISIMAIGIGVLLLFHTRKYGLGLILAAITTLILSITLSSYALWVGLAGLGFLLLGFLSIVYIAWRKNKALKEIVGNVQTVKRGLRDEDRGQLRVAFGEQSKSTKKLVQEIKTNEFKE